MRVGVEVGGTFTDLVVVRDGKIAVAKVPSTPHQPDIGVLNALAAVELNLQDIDELVHGSTVATNAVLERKGGRVGVLVTKGTGDLFALQRHDRSAIYDLHYRKPVPVIAQGDVYEINERLASDGSIVRALDDDVLDQVVQNFLASGSFDAIAICLLHAYANPAHERQVAKVVRRHNPDLPITLSSDVSPEFREYERASTTALAAYVQPVIAGYLNRLTNKLSDGGFNGRFSIMQSNGGRMPASSMAQNAIAALFSGPAAGVVGAMGVAERSGFKDIITLDMGGTSTDVSLISNGRPELAPQTVIDGLPVRTPVIDIATVGAGGGSIAWIDDGDLLRVGPQSAGAHPGPACYGRGGTAPTITDAHLIRGTMRSSSFVGGTMDIDHDAAATAFGDLSKGLGMTIEALADSAIRVAEGNIVRAVQQVSTERGLDPRDFVLVPFGGAGPLHAARVAEDLGIRTILIPLNAGVLSAAGLLMSDYVHYRSKTERLRLDEQATVKVRDILSMLRREAEDYMKEVGVAENLKFEYVLEMRYVGQAFELSVPLTGELNALSYHEIFEAFRAAHHRVFEFSKPPEDPAEIVSYRVGVQSQAEPFPSFEKSEAIEGNEFKSIEVVEGGVSLTCKLAKREQIDVVGISGALLIEDGTSTVYIPPGWHILRDQIGNLIAKYEG
jgi:N-methylhydantoinase A